MTPAEFLSAMRALVAKDTTNPNYHYWDFLDPINGHKEADELMLATLEGLGYDEGCSIFRSADKYYA